MKRRSFLAALAAIAAAPAAVLHMVRKPPQAHCSFAFWYYQDDPIIGTITTIERLDLFECSWVEFRPSSIPIIDGS
jgi:hypothetical protein